MAVLRTPRSSGRPNSRASRGFQRADTDDPRRRRATNCQSGRGRVCRSPGIPRRGDPDLPRHCSHPGGNRRRFEGSRRIPRKGGTPHTRALYVGPTGGMDDQRPPDATRCRWDGDRHRTRSENLLPRGRDLAWPRNLHGGRRNSPARPDRQIACPGGSLHIRPSDAVRRWGNQSLPHGSSWLGSSRSADDSSRNRHRAGFDTGRPVGESNGSRRTVWESL